MKRNSKNVGLVLALAVTFIFNLAVALQATAQGDGSITLVAVEAPNEGNWPETGHTGESWSQFRGYFLKSIEDDIPGFYPYGDPFATEGRGVYIPVPEGGKSTWTSLITTPDFHSWKGKVVSTDGGAYGTADFVEFGGRIHFSNEIEAPEGMYFRLNGVKYHFRSPDDYYNEIIEFPLVFNSTRVGKGINGEIYNNPAPTGLGNTKLQNLKYVGVGIGLESFGSGSTQQRIQNTLAYMVQSGFTLTCTVTVKWYRISDDSSAGELSESLTVNFGDCPTQAEIDRSLASIRFQKVGQDAHFTFESLNGVYFRPIRTVNKPTVAEFQDWYSIPELEGQRLRPHRSAKIIWQGGATGTERYYSLQAVSICSPLPPISGWRVIRDGSAEPTRENVLAQYRELDLKGQKPPRNILVP